MDIPCIRFDDLSAGGSGSFGLLDPSDSILANRVDDVVPALLAAEQAAASGKWVAGFVSYEAAPAFNDVLEVRPQGLHDPMRELPLAYFQTFERRIELDQIDSVHFPTGAYNVSAWTADSTHHENKEDLATVGRAIMAGELARLTHTFRLHAAFSGDPAALYRDLLLSQRGSHAACLDVGRFRIVSASPAAFFRRLGSSIVLRPVLASIRRGRWLDEDLHLAGLLRAEGEESFTNKMVIKEIESELAELGDPVSVPIADRFSVARFETLWQLTAEIETALRPDVGIVEIFRALFPPVSVTGVPKPEAMQLITGTEDTPRGVYCGAIGYLAPSDSEGPHASFNVAVRTVIIDQEEGVAEFGVGTAITNRSDVVSAYEEARLKAKVLVNRRPDFRLCEEMRVDDGVARYEKEKVARLVSSGLYFGFDVDEDAIGKTVHETVASSSGDCRISVLLGRDGGIEIETAEAPTWCDSPNSPYVLIGAVASQPVPNDNVYLFHCTTDKRLPEVLSRKHPDADVVFIVNQYDEVAGSMAGNLVVEVHGRWVTPPLSCGARGTSFRAELLRCGVIEEGLVTRQELDRADKVMLIDDVHGWRTVGMIG